VLEVPNFLKLLYNICNIPPERYVENQLALSFNWTSQHVLCAGDVKLLHTDEHSIKKNTKTSFMSGYVLRNLIVSRRENAKQYQNFLLQQKKNPLKMYQNSGIREEQREIEFLSRER